RCTRAAGRTAATKPRRRAMPGGAWDRLHPRRRYGPQWCEDAHGAPARERRLHISAAGLGVFAPPVMGMAFAFGWTPCIGPVLATVLTAAADQATLGRGVALLVAYSLGLGVPFVAAGLAAGRLATVFDWLKGHARAINLVAGLVLVGFGLLLVTNRVSRVALAMAELMDKVGLGFLSRI
ncbi:MAG: cytochrome c biogenesis CcdA family protein, partial [Acidimicrobiales bacterium]